MLPDTIFHSEMIDVRSNMLVTFGGSKKWREFCWKAFVSSWSQHKEANSTSTECTWRLTRIKRSWCSGESLPWAVNNIYNGGDVNEGDEMGSNFALQIWYIDQLHPNFKPIRSYHTLLRGHNTKCKTIFRLTNLEHNW